jgi:hypothetical protein
MAEKDEEKVYGPPAMIRPGDFIPAPKPLYAPVNT